MNFEDDEGDAPNGANNEEKEEEPTRTTAQQRQDRNEEDMGKVGDELLFLNPHQQDPMRSSVSVVDSLLHNQRSQQQLTDHDASFLGGLADMYRFRRDQEQLQYMQEQLAQERRLQTLLLQQRLQQQQPQQHAPQQPAYPDIYEGARQELLLRRQMQQQMAAGSLSGNNIPSTINPSAASPGRLVEPFGLPGHHQQGHHQQGQHQHQHQHQLLPEAELYAAALRDSAATRAALSLTDALGYNMRWGGGLEGLAGLGGLGGGASNAFDPSRRSFGGDYLSSGGAGSAMGFLGEASASSSASLQQRLAGFGTDSASMPASAASAALSSWPRRPMDDADSPGQRHAHSTVRPPSSSPRKRPSKGTGWPKDRPKRPLSAYNFFFKEERARILAELPETTSATTGDDAAATMSDPPAKKTRRRRRNTHGKISFEGLAKTIGRRWQEQTPEQVRYYKEMADCDMQRYRRELETYNDPAGVGATRAADASTAPTADVDEDDDEADQKPAARQSPTGGGDDDDTNVKPPPAGDEEGTDDEGLT